ncbi:MAG: protein translocase subunit SecF, partial [Thiolinea sp.]
MLFKDKIIDFMGVRKIALIISMVLILISIGSIFARGLNLGIDFTGGTVMEVGYPESKSPDAVRKLLQENGYDGTVQHFGSAKDIMIRLAPQEGADKSAEAKAKLSNDVLAVLKGETPEAEMRRVEFVGP